MKPCGFEAPGVGSTRVSTGWLIEERGHASSCRWEIFSHLHGKIDRKCAKITQALNFETITKKGAAAIIF
jgi:hypothetical protein